MRRIPHLLALAVLTAFTASCGGSDSDSNPTTPPQTFTLSVAVTGNGAGSVTSSPAGITCSNEGGTCTATFNEGTAVTLTATPAAGNNAFSGWGGACSGTGGCSVTVNSNTSVEASFEDTTPVQHTLTVTVGGDGAGSVTSSPAGIDCSNSGGTCSAAFNEGTAITLTATPAEGNNAFGGWGGACSGTDGCSVTITANTTVEATFSDTTPTVYTIDVTLSGDGDGTVTSSPAGISCTKAGGTCSAQFNEGTALSFTATPAGASDSFTGWGGACSGTGDCAFTVSANATVTADFDNTGLVVTTVGAAGATLNSADGMAEIVIPAGALTADTEISIRTVNPSELTGSLATVRDRVGMSKVYEFGPAGTTFAQPVQFRVTTGATAEQGGASFETGFVLHTSGSDTELPASQTVSIDETTGAVTMTGTITHFSELAATGGGWTDTWANGASDGEQASVTCWFDTCNMTPVSRVVHWGPTITGSATFTDRSSSNPNQILDFSGNTRFRDNEAEDLYGFESWGEYKCSSLGSGRIDYDVLLTWTGDRTMARTNYVTPNCLQRLTTLNVSFTGDAPVTVTSTPAGLSCSYDPAAPSTCSAEFPVGTNVQFDYTHASANQGCGTYNSDFTSRLDPDNSYSWTASGSSASFGVCSQSRQLVYSTMDVASLNRSGFQISPGTHSFNAYNGTLGVGVNGTASTSGTMYFDSNRNVFGLPYNSVFTLTKIFESWYNPLNADIDSSPGWIEVFIQARDNSSAVDLTVEQLDANGGVINSTQVNSLLNGAHSVNSTAPGLRIRHFNSGVSWDAYWYFRYLDPRRWATCRSGCSG